MIKINLATSNIQHSTTANNLSGVGGEAGKRKLLMQSRRIINQHESALNKKICQTAHNRRIILAKRFLNTAHNNKRVQSCLKKILLASIKDFTLFYKQAQMAETCVTQLMKRHNIPKNIYGSNIQAHAKKCRNTLTELLNEYTINRASIFNKYYRPLGNKDFKTVVIKIDQLYKETHEYLVNWQYEAVNVFNSSHPTTQRDSEELNQH